jgi:hypothetical protein
MTQSNKIINAVLLFITACSLGYIFFIHNSQIKAIDSKAKDYVNAEATIISKKVDQVGIEHAIISETNNLLPQNLMIAEQGYDVAFVDSLIANTDILKKEITSLMQVKQTIEAKNLHANVVIDSMKRRKYEYSDHNLYVSYTPDLDTAKTGQFAYKYNQDLNFIQYNRKKWFLGADHNYMDISTNDKNSTINGVRKLSILQPPKTFGVTLTAKSVYLPQSGSIGMGAQLRVRYKKLTATGSNLYFPTSSKFIPVLGLEYDLLNY